MRVRQIIAKNFMRYEALSLTLPERGVVVVTGDNGEGKSAIIEVVATAFWGKTLRGTPGWNGSGVADVSIDGLESYRELSGKKTKLYWKIKNDGTEAGAALDSLHRLGGLNESQASGNASDRDVYETTTKAQEALEAHVGTFDVWRRSCAFSSSDANHFSMATDGERKRLLEMILGLDKFDTALDRCRAELKHFTDVRLKAEVRYAEARTKAEHAQERLAQAQEELEALEAEPQMAEPPPADVAEEKRLAKLVGQLEAKVREVKAREREPDSRYREAVSRVRVSEEAARSARTSGHCPVCKQKLPGIVAAGNHFDAEIAKLISERTDAKTALDEVKAKIRDEVSELEADVVKARMAFTKACTSVVLAKERFDMYRGEQSRLAVAQANLTNRAAELKHRRDELKGFEDAFKIAVEHMDSLIAVEAVLGLRGVRAHVLGSSLAGIEAVANTWLPRFGLVDMMLTLKPYSERKKGGVTDAISIELDGAGGGYGYKGASAGERRRVDLALLLAVGEVSAAAQRRPNPTLFFDEVFDHIDAAGRKALCRALVDLSQDRCVVVISHDAALIEGLPAVKRWHVAGGEVEVT